MHLFNAVRFGCDNAVQRAFSPYSGDFIIGKIVRRLNFGCCRNFNWIVGENANRLTRIAAV
jgi:hypothetical protein